MKGLRSYFIGSAIFLVLYLVAQYYRPVPTDWTSTYLKEDKIPFGTYILNQEMEHLFPEAKVKTSRLPVYNTLKGKAFKNTSYLFIAGKLKFDKLDYRELTRFMEAGNHVFIAAYNLGELLSDTLKLDINTFSSLTGDKRTPISFVNPALGPGHKYALDKELGHLFFNRIDTSRVTVLGINQQGKPNFVKYTFGKGALYILPDPKLLTNFNLLNPEGAAYAAKALSYLPASANLILDENNTRGNIADTSILRVIFAHPPLAWAYTIALTGLVLFVLFEMKRRQRIIPVISPLKNSSVEFVNVVGRVYYQQRDNRDITEKKITYFLEYIRTAYRLKTTTIDQELAEALIIKSGVPAETILELFNIIRSMETRGKVSDSLLINLNKLIENFYKQVQ